MVMDPSVMAKMIADYSSNREQEGDSVEEICDDLATIFIRASLLSGGAKILERTIERINTILNEPKELLEFLYERTGRKSEAWCDI